MRVASLVTSFLVILALGCASTTVRKNPGVHDRGVRYNLPKPYLLLKPSVKLDENGKIASYVQNSVDIVLEMRPDYSEEYSIHVRAGVGANKTSITLEDGWKLKTINFNVDSKTSENIGAVAELISALPKFTPARAGTEAGAQELASNVPAFNVPLGYYESVIGQDNCGKKHLYGWRYLGFLPFNPCPTAACGSQAANCCEGDIFGLVYEKGVMTFKRLDQIATEDLTGRVKPGAKP